VSSAAVVKLPAGDRALAPRRPDGLVPRARLVRRLREAGDVPVALLVAPAGYGKTTVLTEWDQQDPRSFAWIRVGDDHDDPATLIAAVAGALGADTSPGTLEGLAEHLARARDPFVLVLDDVHTLHDAHAFDVLETIAESIPRGSQLALASRAEPPMAVGRLRAHRKVVEVRTADLAMGRSEAAALLELAGLRLGGADLDSLVGRTEGWPVGLYLAALSLRAQGGVRGAAERFAGDDRVVAEYVRDELLAPLSAERIAFLRRTSVLDTLSSSACDAVLDRTGTGSVLAELARSNVLLVSLDRSGELFRHHRLFAEMLRAELRRVEPDLEPELHRRASAWYAARGEAHAAIRQAIAAGDVRAAGDLLWAHAADRIAGGENDTVARWLGEFTAEQTAAYAPLAVVAAASSLAAGDRGQFERWIAEADRSNDLRPGEAEWSLGPVVRILRAAGAREGVSRMGAEAAGACRSVPDRSPWWSIGKWLEGVSRHLTGSHGAARGPLEEGGRGGAAAAPNIQALCLAQLGLLATEDEDWDEAAALLSRARSQVKACGLEHYPTLALVFAVSGLVRAHRGMVEEAREDMLWSARLLSRLVDFAPWYEAETRIALARAALRLGDVSAARTLMTEAAHTLRDTPESTTLRAWLDETRTHLEAATRSATETCALTTAELRVLRLLPTHLSYPAIATRLYVSPNTVKTHVRALYRKLDASSREDAVAHASAAGLLDDAQAA
jgi:LuxR family maltose regulon positive regulatory protein